MLIGQNRQAAVSQAKADHDFVEQGLELKTNTELTRAVHSLLLGLEGRFDAEAGDQGPPPALTGAPADPRAP